MNFTANDSMNKKNRVKKTQKRRLEAFCIKGFRESIASKKDTKTTVIDHQNDQQKRQF